MKSKISNPQFTKIAIPKLLDLGSKKCVPCKQMAPILEKMEKDYQGIFDVEFIDVWLPENQKIAIQYKVEAIPTQLFLDAKGKELWRHVGFFSEQEILNKWKDLGYKMNRKSTKESTKTAPSPNENL